MNYSKLPELKLPACNIPLKIKKGNNRVYFFDKIRKRNVLLTPEEWVRQHVINFFINEKNWPRSLIRIEREIKINNSLRKRADAVLVGPNGSNQIIIECKAPNIKLTQDVFDQSALYNTFYKAPYIFVSNGMQHYCCAIDHDSKNYRFTSEVPHYADFID